MAESNRTSNYIPRALRPLPAKSCKTCGNCFAPSRADRLYCCVLCRNTRPRGQRPPSARKPKALFCHGCQQWCERVIRSGKDDGKFCSQKCYLEAKVRNATYPPPKPYVKRNPVVIAEAAALRRIARYVERPRKTVRPCACCGSPAIGTLEIRRTCKECREAKAKARKKILRQRPGAKAQKLRAKAIRRARMKVEADTIDPMDVFYRDDWKCRICGVDTPMTLRGGYDPTAPELDHVIPLALGGGHTWDNVQCACRQCNGQKGASLTPRGEAKISQATAT